MGLQSIQKAFVQPEFPWGGEPITCCSGEAMDITGRVMWSLTWAEQAGRVMLCSPLSSFLGSCTHGSYTPPNFPCMQPKQVCQMTAYLCHPCDFFQPGFKNSFWAIMCHIRINLHAGASFLSPQNNSTTVSTFQCCLFFFFSAQINSFCSKRTQYNQEIISLK